MDGDGTVFPNDFFDFCIGFEPNAVSDTLLFNKINERAVAGSNPECFLAIDFFGGFFAAEHTDSAGLLERSGVEAFNSIKSIFG